MQDYSQLSAKSLMDTKSLLSHFMVMMGQCGLYQHATIRKPLLEQGYCTDDNARAVQMLARLLQHTPDYDKQRIRELLVRCWNFICEARQMGHYYNFRKSDGTWISEGESDDMYARLIRSFIEVISTPELKEFHGQANDMLHELLEQAQDKKALRFWAECLISFLNPSFKETEIIASLIKKGKNILVSAWEQYSTPEWPWFEDRMAYANALLPHGMLAALLLSPDSLTKDILHQSTDFLIKTTVIDDIFIPIGSNGWYQKGGVPSRDNQQAIDANTMFDFLLSYEKNEDVSLSDAVVAAPYLWFFGQNTNKTVLADEATGACLDGLFTHGPNPNNGAESMLAYQWSEILLREAPETLQQYILNRKANLLHKL